MKRCILISLAVIFCLLSVVRVEALANAKGCTGSLSRDGCNASLFDNETGRALNDLYELKNFKINTNTLLSTDEKKLC